VANPSGPQAHEFKQKVKNATAGWPWYTVDSPEPVCLCLLNIALFFYKWLCILTSTLRF